MRSLFWFRQDLRVNDNPGVLAQKDASQLLLVYLWPKERPWCNVNGMGKQRRRFLLESLQALRNELTSDNKNARMGFTYGGAPKIDSPPVARDASEKKALAALAKMAKGKWHLNITTREGRVLRQLVEASGAKCVVEIGTSSGYSTIWLAMGARAAGGRVITHEIDPEMIKIAQANFKLDSANSLLQDHHT